MKTNSTSNSRSRKSGGRPPKFDESCRPVTITLPERTLNRLGSIDKDRAKAIVKAVDHVFDQIETEPKLMEVTPAIRIIVVPSTHVLTQIPWLTMIEISPFQYMLTIVPGTTIEKIEVGLSDLIEDSRSMAPMETEFLNKLKEQLTQMRRKDRISKAEILFVNGSKLDSDRSRVPTNSCGFPNSG